MTLAECVHRLIEHHGSIRKAADATKVDKGYLSRMWRGHKINPSEKTLRQMGLTKTITYELRK